MTARSGWEPGSTGVYTSDEESTGSVLPDDIAVVPPETRTRPSARPVTGLPPRAAPMGSCVQVPVAESYVAAAAGVETLPKVKPPANTAPPWASATPLAR